MAEAKLDPLRQVLRLRVPIDRSKVSYSALASVSDIARVHHANVEALYVIEEGVGPVMRAFVSAPIPGLVGEDGPS